MAIIQIPNLPAAIGLDGSELFEGVQAGTSVKINLAQMIAAVRVGFPTTLPIPVSVGGTGVTTSTGTGSVVLSDSPTLTGRPAFTGSPTITTNSASAALTITQTGAGASILVQDSASPDINPFVVDATGNVGIGTTAPVVKLDVAGTGLIARLVSTTTAAWLRFDGSGTSFPYIGLIGGIGVFGNTDASPIAFNTNSLERMRIDASGNITAGSSTTAITLDVGGNINLPVASTQARGIQIGQGRTGNGNSFIDFVGDATYSDYGLRIIRGDTGANAVTGIIHRGTGDLYLTSVEAGSISFNTTNAQRYRIGPAGQLGVGGANYGTTGQTIISAGASVAPAWGTLPVAGGGTGVTSSTGTGSVVLSDSPALTGQVSFADGTAAAPSIAHAGDLNAGIFFPAADTVAITTSGLERMRIEASGNITAGSTTSNITYSIGGTLSLPAATTENRAIEIGQGRTGNGNSFIDFVGDATYSDYGLRIIRGNIGANSTSGISHRGTGALYLAALEAASISFSTTNQERMRVTSDGNVGIVTASPYGTLTVGQGVQPSGSSPSSKPNIEIWQGSNTVNDAGGIDLRGSAAGLGYGWRMTALDSTGVHLAFANRNGSATYTEVFRMASAGQLGIGGANYGTSGQALVSGGPSAAPSWSSVGTFTNLSASGTVSGTGFSAYLASPPDIGGTAAASITGAPLVSTTVVTDGFVTLAAGTLALAFASKGVVQVTPNATGTFTTTIPPAGTRCTLIVLTSGTTTYTMTFGTGFKTTGTLITGTITAQRYVFQFISDGTSVIEASRTIAIA